MNNKTFLLCNISLVSSSIVLFCFVFFSLLCLFKIVYKNKLLLFSLFLYFFIFIFLLSFFLSFVYFFSFLFFVYLFLYFFFSFLFFSFLFIIKSGDGGHRSHCPFHAKEMLYHLSYIPIPITKNSSAT